jgi:hypothetical protein
LEFIKGELEVKIKELSNLDLTNKAQEDELKALEKTLVDKIE